MHAEFAPALLFAFQLKAEEEISCAMQDRVCELQV